MDNQTETFNKIKSEILGIEITDDLIAANKSYSKLGDIYDKYDSLIDSLSEESDKKEIKALKKMQDEVYEKMRKIMDHLHLSITLSRGIKKALMIKALK